MRDATKSIYDALSQDRATHSDYGRSPYRNRPEQATEAHEPSANPPGSEQPITYSREEQIHMLATSTPHSFATMQKLVMAMAAVYKSRGKRTLFGRSPEVKAYAKLDRVLSEQIISMRLDQLIEHGSTDAEVWETLYSYINAFSVAFPNWQDAYEIAAGLLFTDPQAGIEYVGRRR